MTQESYEREMGSIQSQLKSLSDGQLELRSDVKELKKTVSDTQITVSKLTDNGCARGAQQDKDIAELKKSQGSAEPTELDLGPLKMKNYRGTDVLRVAIAVGIIWIAYTQWKDARNLQKILVSPAIEKTAQNR